MIVFEVVKEMHGWSVRMGQRMSTPFWSRDMAVWEANRLAAGIRRHGQPTEVVVEGGFGQAVPQWAHAADMAERSPLEIDDRSTSRPTFA